MSEFRQTHERFLPLLDERERELVEGLSKTLRKKIGEVTDDELILSVFMLAYVAKSLVAKGHGGEGRFVGDVALALIGSQLEDEQVAA